MAKIQGQKRFLEIDVTEEAVPGVPNGTSAQDMKYVEMVSAGYGVNENAQFDEIGIEANLDSQPAPETAGFAPGGNLQIVAAPIGGSSPSATKSWMRFICDWALTRSSGAVRPYTITQWNPISGAGFGRRITGAKANTLGFSWGSNNRLNNPTLGILGMYPRKATSVPTPSFASYRHWNFTYLGIQVGGTAFTGYLGVATTEKTLRALTLDVNNRITPEVNGYQYQSGTLVTGISELSEGDLVVTGSFECALQNATEYYDRYLAGNKGQLRALGFHPDSSRTTIVDSGGIDTSNSDDGGAGVLDIYVDDASIFTAGDVIYIEDASANDPANWVREVLRVTAVFDSLGKIRVDLDGATYSGVANYESIGRGQTFTNGSYIYNKGIQLLCRELTFTGFEPVGGSADTTYQRIGIRAGKWTGRHPDQGSTFEYPALGYLVA